MSGIFTAGRRAAPLAIASNARSVSPPPIAAALGLTLLAAMVPAAMAAVPRSDRPIAVVGLSAGHAAIIGAIGEAGGSVLSVSGSKVVIAMAGDDGFVSRLRGLGYWLELDAKAFAGCTTLFRDRRAHQRSSVLKDRPEIVHPFISIKRGFHANQHA